MLPHPRSLRASSLAARAASGTDLAPQRQRPCLSVSSVVSKEVPAHQKEVTLSHPPRTPRPRSCDLCPASSICGRELFVVRDSWFVLEDPPPERGTPHPHGLKPILPSERRFHGHEKEECRASRWSARNDRCLCWRCSLSPQGIRQGSSRAQRGDLPLHGCGGWNPPYGSRPFAV